MIQPDKQTHRPSSIYSHPPSLLNSYFIPFVIMIMTRRFLLCLLLNCSLLTHFATCQTTRNCYACASADLKSKWFLTGLAQVPDTYFAGNCNNRASTAMTESCSGPCMTMAFDNPDEIGSAQTPTTYVVRGCHRTLTNVVTDRGDAMNGSVFCEIDNTYRMADRRGNLVNVRMMSSLCGNVDRCNDVEFSADFMAGVPCSNQTNNNLLNNAPLNCYECTPSEGNNCHDSKCTKKYCSKQQVKLDGGFQVMKTCSNVNIFGVDNTCQTFDVFTNQGGVPVRSQYTQCYCKDKQFCNSATSISFSAILASISSIFLSSRLL